MAIAPLQDLLNLGGGARMNIPGQAGGNWRWRSTDDMFSPAAFNWLRDLTKTSNRCSDDSAAESSALQETEVTQ
jgi:4-alpha-glucanotransferase